MADLEALSNKEIRQKCMEFGMPNVPVTDSSRKILIRRLEAVMSGKPLTPNKTNRRETMHVSKPSQMASSIKIDAVESKTTTTTGINNNTSKAAATPNRASRRTIAAPTERHVATTTTVSEPEYSDVSPDRVEITITQKQQKTPEKTLYPKLPAKEPSPKPQQLSKTGVVTTSYIRETQKVNTTYAAPSEEEIDSSEEYVPEPIKAPAPALSKPPSFAYVPVSEPKISTSAPITSNLSSSTRYSALSSTGGGTFGNYTKPSTLSNVQQVRKSYVQPSAAISSSLAASSYRKSAMPTTAAYNKYKDETDDVHYVEDDYDDEDDDDEVVLVDDASPLGKDIQTPFLSQFARNLETLKSTPIRSSMGPSSGYTPSHSGLRQRDGAASYRRTMPPSSSTISARRSTSQQYSDKNQNGDSSFRQFMMVMEEKYHLKQTFALISIFIFAVFIYVFFIQSV